MKELNVNQLENLEAGKFWGKSCGDSWSLEAGSCFRSCSYSVFWIRVKKYSEVVTC